MDRILIVDDNESIRTLLQARFQVNEFECLIAKNGKQAIEIAKAKHPALIILDLMMPEMDGIETYKVLKAFHSTKNIPIIVYTAQDPELVAKKGLDALDIVDFILKPFDSKALVMAVKKAIKEKT